VVARVDALRGRAVIICPPLSEPNPIAALRRRFDPLVDLIPAHITLVFPFESELTPFELRTHIEDAVRGGPGPFPIRLGGISGSDGRFLFVNVKRGNDALIELHDRLYSGPLLAHQSLAFTFAPHVTVGRLPTLEAFEAALAAAAAVPISVETSATSVVVYTANLDGTGALESEVPL
jgi:2'-5' RNA ligase